MKELENIVKSIIIFRLKEEGFTFARCKTKDTYYRGFWADTMHKNFEDIIKATEQIVKYVKMQTEDNQKKKVKICNVFVDVTWHEYYGCKCYYNIGLEFKY